MPREEADEQENMRGIAVQSLQNELELAVRLLRGIKQARDTVAIETEAVESARAAFRHAVEALERVPQLSSEEMEIVQRLIEEFRAALADLEV